MRVPEDKLRSVVFVVDSDGVPRATAFLVGIMEGDVLFPDVVTARHCIEETGNRDFYIRMNVGDRHDDIMTRGEDWDTHDSADVAAILFEGNAGVNYHLCLERLEHFVGLDYAIDAGSIWADHPVPAGGTVATFTGSYDAETAKYLPAQRIQVNVGQEVFFVGLLYEQPGEEKNLPIARFGRVSRMPGEPIVMERRDGTLAELTAYLAECHSWGGSSGSPVYWCHPATRMIPGPEVGGQQTYVPEQIWIMRLLGLVSGHWDIKQEADTEGDILGTIRTAINSGIAVVTPAHAIAELLSREDVMEERKRLAEEFRERKRGSERLRQTALSPKTMSSLGSGT